MKQSDIIIIGAGVVGCAIARHLSRYNLSITLLDAQSDVSMGASKANSGIIHGGYTAKAGTLKGKLSIKGNRLFDALDRDLNFGFKRVGSLVLAFTESDLKTLEGLKTNGLANGVKGLKLLSPQEVFLKEPHINPSILGALYCPETGIVSPYEYCIALAENAIDNGVKLYLNSSVDSINKKGSFFFVNCGPTEYKSSFVINAAGCSSDKIAALIGADNFKIKPRKGQYLLLRRGEGERHNSVIFQPPTEKGKGILVSPTIWNNLLIGPNAEDVEDMDDLGTDGETLACIFKKALQSDPSLNPNFVIRAFSGLRPRGDRGDFIIEESCVKGFFNLGGIESPGLTSSPAIALEVEALLIKSGLSLQLKKEFNPKRRGLKLSRTLAGVKDISPYVALSYGDKQRVVCRCEQVREQSIKEVLSGRIPINSFDAIKRRTRAGMGACQSQFCYDRVEEYLLKESSLSRGDIIGPSRDPKKIRDTIKEFKKILANQKLNKIS